MLQEWVRTEGARVVVVFEGRDAAGKGGTIKRVTQYLNPRVARIVALPRADRARDAASGTSSGTSSTCPAAGEIVLFDRSWYNRAGVEWVMGFCTPEQHRRFLHQCPIFERLLVEDGILLRKYWFSVSDAEQERRFHPRLKDPMRQWKLSPMDLESLTALGGLLPGQGRDVRAHRHPRVALAGRRERRQAPGPDQHDRPPALEHPLPEGAPADAGAAGAGRRRPATSGPSAGCRTRCPTTRPR